MKSPRIPEDFARRFPNRGSSCVGILGRTGMLLEKAIEDRLKSAVSEIQEDFATGQYRDLVRKAPWNLIRLFNQS